MENESKKAISSNLVLCDVLSIRSSWIKNPNIKFNITNKTRKEILISNDTTVIHHADLYDIKFNNLGGGVYETFCVRRSSKNIA